MNRKSSFREGRISMPLLLQYMALVIFMYIIFTIFVLGKMILGRERGSLSETGDSISEEDDARDSILGVRMQGRSSRMRERSMLAAHVWNPEADRLLGLSAVLHPPWHAAPLDTRSCISCESNGSNKGNRTGNIDEMVLRGSPMNSNTKAAGGEDHPSEAKLQSDAFIVQRGDDFVCFLLLQDVCHIDLTPLSYPADQGGGLTGLGLSDLIPGLDGDIIIVDKDEEQPWRLSQLEGGLWFSADPSFNLSKIDVSHDVCALQKLTLPDPSNELYSNDDKADLSVNSKKFGRFVDLDMAMLMEEKLTQIVSHSWGRREVSDGEGVWLDSVDHRGPKEVHKGAPTAPVRTKVIDIGVVSPRDAHLGLFVECVGSIVSTWQQLLKGPISSMVRASVSIHPTLFFPRNKVVGQWSAEIAKVLLGENARVLPGASPARQGARVCFRNAIFPLNTIHMPVGEALSANLAAVGGSPGRKYQISVLWREVTGRVGNLDAVSAVLRQIFPGWKIRFVTLAKETFENQVDIMRTTALFVGMHSPSMANMIFMPPKGIVVELFPYMYADARYRRIALRYGLHYFSWTNQHEERNVYAGGCLKKGMYANLSISDCELHSGCRRCVRELSVTWVDPPELHEILMSGKVVDLLKEWAPAKS